MGLTLLLMGSTTEEAAPYCPVGIVAIAANPEFGGPTHAPFWIKPDSTFGLFALTSL